MQLIGYLKDGSGLFTYNVIYKRQKGLTYNILLLIRGGGGGFLARD